MRNINNMVNICADLLIEIALSNGATTQEDAKRNIKEWINAYTDGTAVGAILFNTNYHISYIPSTVWDTAWRKKDGYEPRYEEYEELDWHKNYVKAHSLGIEPYEIAIEETKKTGASVWFSVRMNEFHYMNRFPKLEAASLWIERPDLRMAEDKPFDYEKKEVRDYYLSYIKELCENWSIDGIELDFWRGPDFFNEPITNEKITLLTDFVKEIRQSVDEIAKKKNKRIMISARTHISPELALSKGWDSACWVADGYVDILTVSDFFVPSNHEMFVEEWIKRISDLGGIRENYGINVCADMAQFCIKYNAPEVKWLSSDTKTLKGFATTYFDKGVDGIYTFNIANRDYKEPKEKRIVNFAEFSDKKSAYCGKRRHILVYNELNENKYKTHLKKSIASNEVLSLELDTSAALKGGSFIVEVGTNNENQQLRVSVNGSDCEYIGKASGIPYGEAKGLNVTEISEVAKEIGLYKCCDLSVLRDGINIYEIKNSSQKTVEIVWFSVEVEESNL